MADKITPWQLLSRLPSLLERGPALAKGLYYLKLKASKRFSIGALIEQHAKQHPNQLAICYQQQTYTYAAFNRQANRYAQYLIQQGVSAGDRVAILLENRPEVLLAVTAIVKLGAIACMVNTSQRHQVLQHSLDTVSPKALVVGEELLQALQGIELGPEVLHLYLDDDSNTASPEGFTDLNLASQDLSDANPVTTRQVRLGDPCFYIFTSGTTGLPKASILTHQRWMKALGGFGHLVMKMQPQDRLYMCLPFYHNNALTVSWGSVLAGASVMIIQRKFSASSFWEDIRRYHATCFCYVGELCRYLLNQAESSLDRQHAVTKMVGNGLRPGLWQTFKQRFHINGVYEFYAASEANMGFANFFNFDETVGICPGEYRIVQYDLETGQPLRNNRGRLMPVQAGEVGLLIFVINCAYPFDGYTDKQANQQKIIQNAFKPGDTWYNSGDLMRDLGFRHARFVDRVGDTFRWKGENVATREVEEAINQLTSVAESTVYGVEVPGHEGRAGMALVMSQPDRQIVLSELWQHLHTRLPNYAVPRFVLLADSIETTATFKHQKHKLKQRGFDPEQHVYPVYYYQSETQAYAQLAPQQFAQIQAEAIAL